METTNLLMNFFSLNPLRVTLLILVSFIATIVLRFAWTNFALDSDRPRFMRWFALTVLAVILTILSNHLVLFWMAWVSISLSVHQLLVFYSARYRAVLAAHKKFIFARATEVFLAIAFLLLYDIHHTFLISEILQQAPLHVSSWQQQTATILLGLVALIKCAQLPLHGWLIQVVESPTPVSALLHAGIVNLGGFLLLLFSPLLSQSIYAQWLVLIIAGMTACFAALVMMTRISIKVRLAWSTTAQMGLMLVECALGLYQLALLHLVAHSCYKAYAFLRTGSAVSDDIKNQYLGRSKISLNTLLISFILSVLILWGLSLYVEVKPPFVTWLLLGMALTFSFLKGLEDAVLLVGLYLLLKIGVGFILPHTEHSYLWQADLFVSALFGTVWLFYFILENPRFNRMTQKLFIALNAGFYLDEWSTRLTLKIWPIKIPKRGDNNE
jgi:NAD(P)H-quinone oxidoreductase subunit 5